MTFDQFRNILRARWRLMLLTLLFVIGITVAAGLLLPPRYTATATVVLDFKGVDPISGGILPILPVSSHLATQVDIIKSYSVARKTVDLLKLAESPAARELHMAKVDGKGDIRNFLAEFLLEYLTVEPSRESSVINISFTGNDPRFAAAVANGFVQSYMTTNLELKVTPARQAHTFFNEQINALKNNLEKAQAALSEYQRRNGIIATDERLDVETNRLNDLSTQLVAAQGQTYDSLSRQRQVQDFLARGEVPDSLPDVVSNPVIQSLKANLTQLEVKLNDLRGKVGKNHPAYLAVIAEMDGVKAKMIDEMKTISSALGNSAALAQKREAQIRAALDNQRATVLKMKQVRDDQAVLIREAESAQRAYDAAMSRMTQTRLESQTTQTNVAVINEAVEPIEPTFPNWLLNMSLAVVLGSMLAVGLAFLRELTDRIVRSEVDLTESLGVPVLGTLGRGRRQKLSDKRLIGLPAEVHPTEA